MRDVQYFGGADTACHAVTTTPEGVELSITWAGPHFDHELTCVLDRADLPGLIEHLTRHTTPPLPQ